MHAKISDLLEYAKTLRFYEAKLAHAEGDRFNLFDLLGVGSREVTTHTPYLAEFLDPKGAHGLGERPLTAFVRRFELNLDPATTEVKKEHWLGPVTPDSGGRVDILLTDRANHQVAIENKIHAADQFKQLARYQGSLPRAKIIYLTLGGREPDDSTTPDTGNILRLSYAEDIIAWQEDCRREAASAPLVRETITQYINLLKRLTGQSTNTRMSEQIVESVLKTPDSLAAYQELLGAQTALQTAILARLGKQCEDIAEPLALKFKFSEIPPLGQGGSLNFTDDRMDAQAISIGFKFNAKNYRGLRFGIWHHHPSQSHLAPPGLLEGFRREFGGGESVLWWPAIMDWPSRNRYDWSDETFADIAFGRFKPELKDIVEKLAKIVRAAQGAPSK